MNTIHYLYLKFTTLVLQMALISASVMTYLAALSPNRHTKVKAQQTYGVARRPNIYTMVA